jgi:hypothetical protein
MQQATLFFSSQGPWTLDFHGFLGSMLNHQQWILRIPNKVILIFNIISIFNFKMLAEISVNFEGIEPLNCPL